ncbi:hypothetical protein ACFQY0_20790 [Haloferula chungangensis]|uniref:Uncharacterized protein n=1 Tax=Haloferula chungangensis TaxID=1048331 RepID=A0ABW2LE54_9BACT
MSNYLYANDESSNNASSQPVEVGGVGEERHRTGFYEKNFAMTLSMLEPLYREGSPKQRARIEQVAYLVLRNYWVGTRKLGAEKNRHVEIAAKSLVQAIGKSEKFWAQVDPPENSKEGSDAHHPVVRTPFDQKGANDVVELKTIEDVRNFNQDFRNFLLDLMEGKQK